MAMMVMLNAVMMSVVVPFIGPYALVRLQELACVGCSVMKYIVCT